MPINVHFATTDRSGITRDSALVEGIHDAIFELAVDRGVITQKRAASLLKKLESARTAGQLAAVGKTVAALIAPHETKPVVIHRNRRRRNSSAEDYDRFLDAKHRRRLASEARLETRLERREAEAATLIGELQRGPKTVYYINILGKNGRPTGRIKEGTYAELVNYLLRNKYV